MLRSTIFDGALAPTIQRRIQVQSWTIRLASFFMQFRTQPTATMREHFLGSLLKHVLSSNHQPRSVLREKDSVRTALSPTAFENGSVGESRTARRSERRRKDVQKRPYIFDISRTFEMSGNILTENRRTPVCPRLDGTRRKTRPCFFFFF